MGLGDPRESLEFNPVGAHTSGTDVSSAAELSAPSGATKLMIQTITQNVRITLDGTAPTTTSGFQLVAGDPMVMIPLGGDTTIKVIEETATAVIQYQWGNAG